MPLLSSGFSSRQQRNSVLLLTYHSTKKIKRKKTMRGLASFKVPNKDKANLDMQYYIVGHR